MSICILLISVTVNAQNIDISNTKVKKAGGNLVISFDAGIDKVPTNSMLTITPVLWNDSNEVSLSPIVAIGRNKNITMARKKKSVGYEVIKGSDIVYGYEVIVPFEKWMGDISLRVDNVLEMCRGKLKLTSMVIATDKLRPVLLPIPLSDVEFKCDIKAAYAKYFQKTLIDSVAVYYVGAKEDFDDSNRSLSISFRKGSSVVDRSYMNNVNSIRDIQKTIDVIKADSNVYITKIVVVGCSSPEGSYKFNENLSLARADSFIDYFSPNKFDDRIFKVKTIGENWSGLKHMVKNSNMKYKAEVLSIIDKYSIFEGREKKLMDLAGGVPYRYMFKEFFPDLRMASHVQIFYDIHYGEEFVKIDEASMLIKSMDYHKALDLLHGITPMAYTDNLKGVCYMMLSDSVNARIYLQKSIDAGSLDAKKNLESLNYQIDNVQYE